jgi:hypothetical protein
MRFEDLAARLVAVEAKLANLTGSSVNTNSATSIDELDARLSLVEVQVDQLITVKIQSQIEAIVAAPAADAPVSVEAVVALSASSEIPEAADIVADVVAAQVEAVSVEHTEVAEIIAAAVMAVVEASPEVVVDAEAITAAIMEAVADMPAPAPEVAAEVAAAVAEIIVAATGEAVSPEVQQQVVEAVATPSDPALDAIEARLNVAEAKVDSLLGK